MTYKTQAGSVIDRRHISVVDFECFTDARGTLTVLPPCVRAFHISGVGPDVTRGHHAHRQCHQFLTCISGECYVASEDKRGKKTTLLNSIVSGLHLPPLTWAFQFGFSADAVLLVLASHPYDKADYITDYEEFRKLLV